MAIKLEMLRCFVAVAETGNLSDAANRLGRSPSAVSMMLKQFEEHLGQSLFESDRKSRLSPVGAHALDHARRGLRHFDEAVQEIDLFAHAGTGTVRIAAVPSIAGTLMPRILDDFLRAHPNVQIDLRDMDSGSILTAVQAETVDMGLATAAPTTPGIRRLPLLSDPFGVVCAQSHPLAQSKTPVHWTDLHAVRFIANALCTQITEPDFQEILSSANLNVHNTLSLLSMVQADLGVTILPEMAVRLNPAGLHFRPLLRAGLSRHVDILFREGRISPIADILGRHIQHATQQLQSEKTPI